MRGLLVTDLDGTLIDAGRQVPERNRAAIRRANEEGVAVAIVTGRRQSTIHPEHEKLQGLRYRVGASNGSVILGEDNLSIERVRAMSWDLALELGALAALRHAPLVCITTGDEPAIPQRSAPDCFVLDGGDRRWHRTWRWSERDHWEPSGHGEAVSQQLVHLALHLPSREEAEELEPEVKAIAPDGVEVHTVIAPYSKGGLIEVVPKGGKAWALEYLAGHYGVALESTAAVGDEINDAVMLDAAGHAYAVGGSILAERRPAATEVGPATDGAVADAIESFLERLA